LERHVRAPAVVVPERGVVVEERWRMQAMIPAKAKMRTPGGPWRSVARRARAAVVLSTLVVASVGTVSPGCRARPESPAFEIEPYLLVWAGDADRQHDDFLAVIDADPMSESYGAVVRTVPVGTQANEPHAMETRQGPDGLLLAGGLLSGRTFVFDVRDPRTARLVYVDTPREGRRYATPRAYVRLENDHRLATFGDRRGYRGGVVEVLHSAGGLVEFGSTGRFLREVDAGDPSAAGMVVSPHGLAVSQRADRVVTTDAGHGYAATAVEWTSGVSVQVRRLSTGELVHTIPLGVGNRGDENLEPLTVHLLRGGTSAMVTTGDGGALYASWTIATSNPAFALAYDFGVGSHAGQAAITPNERFYFQTLAGANRLDVLDIRDPRAPRPVAKLRFDRDPEGRGGAREGGPHGIAMGADGHRLAVLNYTVETPARHRDGDRRVYIVDADPESGSVAFDLSFRDELLHSVGIDFNRVRWPHGATGPARPAAAVFAKKLPPPEQED
jgi:hypothetical protein